MTDIRRRTIAVVGQNIEHDSCTAWPIPLVKQLLIIASLSGAKPLLNGSIDIVLRDIVCLCLGKGKFQAHIPRGISAAHADGNCDLASNLRCNLAANRIICALFTFDVCPF